jgi:hypothetical protein
MRLRACRDFGKSAMWGATPCLPRLLENQPIAVFRKSGLPMQLGRDENVLHVTFALQPDA